MRSSTAPRAVLIVTYERELLEFLQFFFRLHDWVVDFPDAHVGPTRKIAMHRYDLIVVDLELPVGNGVEFVQVLRLRGDQTPSLVVSSSPVAMNLAPRVEKLPHTAALEDPFCVERLGAACANLLAMTAFRLRRRGA